ncbi:hypothetical protein D3C74_493270 [compost metagenome]
MNEWWVQPPAGFIRLSGTTFLIICGWKAEIRVVMNKINGDMGHSRQMMSVMVWTD